MKSVNVTIKTMIKTLTSRPLGNIDISSSTHMNMKFAPVINCKMLTIVGILKFMTRVSALSTYLGKNFSTQAGLTRASALSTNLGKKFSLQAG